MSDRNTQPADTDENFVVSHAETLINEDGTLRSSVAKVRPTKDVIDAILSMDNKHIHDPAGSYITNDGLTSAVLAKDTLANLPGPNDLPPDDAIFDLTNYEDDPRPFVGANPQFKWMPDDLPPQGRDPMGLRSFIGDEFPRMLAYGPPVIEQSIERDENGRPRPSIKVIEEGKPAFWSHFKKKDGSPIESMEDLKGQSIKVNIATHVPDYMRRGTVAASMEGRKDFSFNGQSLDESFVQITEKVEKAWRRYAKDFEKTFGIRLDVRRDDSDDPHPEKDVNVSVLGFAGGNPQLAGFASFPPAMSEWSNFRGLGHQQGFMMLNHEYSNAEAVSEDMLYDLIFHEMGHFFGMVHPHDLGAMKMSQAEALNSTAMAYTDGKFAKFPNQEGTVCGVVDLFFRRYMAEAPEINTEHATVYDLEAQFKEGGKDNWQSKVAAMTGLIPAIPILNNGTGVKLIGTRGNDIIDTEPGHMSKVKNTFGVEQRFALVEGHIEKVHGRWGDNKIFTSSHGSQEIYPGPGNNEIHIYAPNIGNDKTIDSIGPGEDTLILHQDVFIENPDLDITQDGNDIVISCSGGSVVLKDQLKKGKGVTSLTVIDDEGRDVLSRNVNRLELKGFRSDILHTMKREVKRWEEEQAEKAANGEEVNDEAALPPGEHNHEHCSQITKPGSFAERLRQREEGQEKGR